MALFTNSADNSEPAPRKVVKIAILGAGSWGTAFAKIVADSARENKTGVQVVLLAAANKLWQSALRLGKIVNIFRG